MNATELFPFNGSPGIRRDGTELDSPFYADGEWVRFKRGRPRKMGGYRAMSQLADGPVRSVLVDSRSGVNSVHTFSQFGVQRLQFGNDGSGGALEPRTPPGFVPNAAYTWQQALLSSSSGGSYTALLAACSPDLNDIASDSPGFLYAGDISTSDPLMQLSDPNGPIRVSGGITVLGPIAVAYGSNGLIKTSNQNDLTVAGWTVTTGGFADEFNPASTKIVYGAPVRGGSQSPAGLFWALDALIRMTYIGGDLRFAFDTISQPTSILSKKGVVEHDGKFFWPGVDRFLMYNGVVQEIPNEMNLDWFFDNLNINNRNKVWGTKITRWGEIWWFFPFGNATECDAAVIFNYREGTWYDARKVRGAGHQAQVFAFPVWAGSEDSTATRALPVGSSFVLTSQTNSGTNVLNVGSTTGLGLANGQVVTGLNVPANTTVSAVGATTVTMSNNASGNMPAGTSVVVSSMTTPFSPGATITDTVSGATGRLVRQTATQVNVDQVTGAFGAGHALSGSPSGVAAVTKTPFAQTLETLYQHEYGKDKIVGSSVSAIRASVTTKDFGFAIGAPYEDAPKTVDVLTKLTRLEPDYKQVGSLTVEILGRDFAEATPTVRQSQELPQGKPFVTFRNCQARLLRLRITSNEAGGDFQQGQIQMGLEPGDTRSGVET